MPSSWSLLLAMFFLGKVNASTYLAAWKLGHPFFVNTSTEDRMDWNMAVWSHSDMAHIHGQCVIKSRIQSGSKRSKIGQKLKKKVEIIRVNDSICEWVCMCARLCGFNCQQGSWHWWSQVGWIIEFDTNNEWPNAHSLHKVEMRRWLCEKFGGRGVHAKYILCHSTSCWKSLQIRAAEQNINHLLNHGNPKILWLSDKITSL